MRARSLVVAATLVVGAARLAHADPKGEVEKKVKEAMDSYDSMDYDAAKKFLNQALAQAKKSKLEKDPVTAKAYLDLGIVAFVNNDADGAKTQFIAALNIDPKIQIEPAYKSPEMAKLLEEARGQAKGGSAGDLAVESGGPSEDCGSVKGLQHTLIDTAKAGQPQPVEAMLGSDIKAAKVSVMFRPEGSTEFIEVRMNKQGQCKYVGTIPGSGMKGSLVHYYVAAFGENGKPIAAKGSAGSPNIMELTAGGPATANKVGDDEDPLAKSSGGGGGATTTTASAPSGGEVDTGVQVPTGPHVRKVMIAVTGGTGFGYLAGSDKTETMNPLSAGGFGSLPAVIVIPEVDYLVSPQIAIGIAARLGFPVGANVAGHATMGPAGMLRVRYALSETGEGVHVMGQVGAGILRNTVKLSNSMPGQDTDVVAQGPLLVGAGVGYTKWLSPKLAFVADLSALAAIAVTKSLGSAPLLNSGAAADLSLGFALGF
ncbi:MAG TPA: tetratricopeptide repeat protein [Kofleriaceae bacterium]|nr:tetratricopeptide repeat protein [Kofleriaceae bacterium]